LLLLIFDADAAGRRFFRYGCRRFSFFFFAAFRFSLLPMIYFSPLRYATLLLIIYAFR